MFLQTTKRYAGVAMIRGLEIIRKCNAKCNEPHELQVCTIKKHVHALRNNRVSLCLTGRPHEDGCYRRVYVSIIVGTIRTVCYRAGRHMQDDQTLFRIARAVVRKEPRKLWASSTSTDFAASTVFSPPAVIMVIEQAVLINKREFQEAGHCGSGEGSSNICWVKPVQHCYVRPMHHMISSCHMELDTWATMTME